MVMEYRDKFCTPKPIKDCVVTENELIVPMQDIIHHDLGKLFHLEPDLLSEIKIIEENNPEAGLEAVIKYGKFYSYILT